MKKILSKGLALTLAGLLMTTFLYAQMDKSKRPSPPEIATGTAAGSTITINYSSPAVKGRTIGKEIAPYDKVWRLGANEATSFETSKDIKVEGKDLHAGKYTLYAIPGETEWVFIFNSNVKPGLWGINRDGTATEDPATDVLRVNVKPEKSGSMNERMKFTVNANGFDFEWGDLKVPVSIQ